MLSYFALEVDCVLPADPDPILATDPELPWGTREFPFPLVNSPRLVPPLLPPPAAVALPPPERRQAGR